MPGVPFLGTPGCIGPPVGRDDHPYSDYSVVSFLSSFSAGAVSGVVRGLVMSSR